MVKIKTVVIILKILANFIVHRNFGNLYLVITRLIHKFKTTGWLQVISAFHPFDIKSIEYQEFLVKSKLSPCSGSE